MKPGFVVSVLVFRYAAQMLTSEGWIDAEVTSFAGSGSDMFLLPSPFFSAVLICEESSWSPLLPCPIPVAFDNASAKCIGPLKKGSLGLLFSLALSICGGVLSNLSLSDLTLRGDDLGLQFEKMFIAKPGTRFKRRRQH
jgi:hypothetical protein